MKLNRLKYTSKTATKNNIPVNKNKPLTIIGSELSLNAEISSRDDIRIDGKFNGDLQTVGKIVISEGGTANGNIKGNIIIIQGQAWGDFEADSNFIISPGGSFKGSIRTRNINIMESAFFDGNCIITKDNVSSGNNDLKTDKMKKSEIHEKKDDSEKKDLTYAKEMQKKDSKQNEPPVEKNPHQVIVDRTKVESDKISLLKNKMQQIKSL